MKPEGPRIARFLLRLFTPRDDLPFIVQDLEEGYRRRLLESGRVKAVRWYWWQVLRGVPLGVRPDPETLRRRSWEGALGDVRYGMRGLGKRPLFALGVSGTLAIGLASAAAMFTIVWNVWLAPLPFPDPDGIVRLFEVRSAAGPSSEGRDASEVARRWSLSPPLLEDLRAHDWSTLAGVAGVSRHTFERTDGSRTVRTTALLSSPELFGVLGVVPLAGRPFLSDDVSEVVLTEDYWRRAFGGDPRVVEASDLRLDGQTFRVVGVVALPPGYPPATEVIAPLHFDTSDLVEGMRGARYLEAIARVVPGRTAAEAAAELNAFITALGDVHPQHQGSGGTAAQLGDDLIRPYRGILALLLAAGLSFLALAVVNVAGLVAARNVEGQGDRAVRLALGASEGRLLRAAILESSILGALGAVGGLVVALWALPPIRALVPAEIPRMAAVRIDLPLAVAILAAGLGLGLIVGGVGHLMSRRTPTRQAVRRRAIGESRGRTTLVVAQVALTTLLATGGAMVLRQVATLRAVDVGFAPGDLASTDLVLSQERYETDQARNSAWRALLEGLQARGLDVAVGVNPPMAGSAMTFGYTADGAEEEAFAEYHSVSNEYFRLLGIDLIEGRAFGPDDHEGGAPVVIVNEALAKEHYPSGPAVGRTIRVVSTPRTIVGVVASTRHFGPDRPAPAEVYVPLYQDPWTLGHVLVGGTDTGIGTILTEVTSEVDPALVVPAPGPYTRYLRDWYAPLRVQLIVVGTLALVGMTLAALGLYALVAYTVSSRAREIGIRLALGAPEPRVFARVVRQGLGMSLVGSAVGLAVWLVMLPLTRRVVEGAGATDVAVLLSVIGLVVAVSTMATLAPAWRSMRVDPVTTLKAE